MSLDTSIVPSQWKAAYISPVPKVSPPQSHTDFRQISVTSVLTRIMERIIVRDYLYPALQAPIPVLNFSDQFAFRPTGSTTATLITILQSVTSLLVDNPYVAVIAVDFSKAFDTVRHATLLEKMALLSIPDNVCNWLVDFFQERSHCVRYSEEMSALLTSLHVSYKIRSWTSSVCRAAYLRLGAGRRDAHREGQVLHSCLSLIHISEPTRPY